MVQTCSACGAGNRVPAARLSEDAVCGRCKKLLGPLATPVTVRSAAEFDELLKDSPLPVLVDFWAAWCGPCRAVAPEVEKLAASRKGKAIVVKLDTEALPDVAGRYGIRGIPTFIKFERGQEVQRTSGAMPAEALASRVGLSA